MLIKDIIAVMEAFAPSSYQESYDNAGLLSGNSHDECMGVLLCIDCVEAIVEEAIEKNCNLIIAHHPIIFSGLKKFTGKNYVERTIIKALKHDIAIYAAHTNLDNMYYGVNHKIAQIFELQHRRILAPQPNTLCKLFTYVPHSHKDEVLNALFAAGAGHIGNYAECSFSSSGTGSFQPNILSNPYIGRIGERHHEEESKIEVLFQTYQQQEIIRALLSSHPYEEVAYDIVALHNPNPYIGAGMIGELNTAMDEKDFLLWLKDRMDIQHIRHTSLLSQKIHTVALCGGAGSFLLNHAIQAGAQIFISGDFKYHQFFDADNKIVIADIGHYESEQFTVQLFYDILYKKFPTFALHLTKHNTNPVNFI